LRPYKIDEALETMSVPISSINHIKVKIYDERDFKILEKLSNRAKRVELRFSILIKEIYEPN
jgi:DNA-binding TFAR19-related protein (PDSD5 family)